MMRKAAIFLLAIFFPAIAWTTSIYDAVDPLPFDSAGYFAAEATLDKILRENEIKTVIEIGSWAGKSTRFLANRVGEEGVVYAIDHWMGTPEHIGENHDPRLPYIYHLFLSNIKQFGLTDRIVPLRMTSEEAHKALENVKADLIFLDGPRDANGVYQSVINWHNHLSETGILCGTEWREKTVRQGVQKAATELGLQIESDRKGLAWVLY